MESVPLEPVDSLTVTTLVDNTTDLLLADEWPATRSPFTHVVRPDLPGGEAVLRPQRIAGTAVLEQARW